MSLDRRQLFLDNRAMETDSSTIYLERIDPSANMARFYCLSVETDLLGDIVTIRRWGRIGTIGRQMITPGLSVAQALVEIEQRAAAKTRRGYRKPYS